MVLALSPLTAAPNVVPAAVSDLDLWDMYRAMLRVRRFEELAGQHYAAGKVGGFLHLGIGEEAVCAGASSVLKPHDHLLTHYRDHGWALARGLEPDRCMAELFGKSTGVSGGRGGSMHFADASKRMWGGYAIVGGHLTLATGLAWAAKVQEPGTIACVVFGEGASNIGEFHEAANLAATWNLPILFLCENNGFGMGTRSARAAAVPDVARRAAAYGMPAWQVDGMDVRDVVAGTREALAFVRSGEGPAILEAHTYRFRGHSMADPELYRDKQEVEAMRSRDPVVNVATELRAIDTARVDAITAEVEAEMQAAVAFAEASPFPDVSTLEDGIVARPDGLTRGVR
ncbi:MAG TPA: thiamine pyrophosphate-dependent enzyme [Candidatus Dormibacteraeota bacterium]|nr:thiamine pyrophosphate-dependent enzyme [Candidatus Dormibacteraeota bacterium]